MHAITPALPMSPADLPAPPRSLAAIAAALALDPPQTQVLWAIAAPALSMPVFRLYRARWPRGPWPSLERACRMVCVGDDASARAAALSHTIRSTSALTRLGVFALTPRAGGDTAVRVAPDVLRALAGRTPIMPAMLRGAATLHPLGVGWGPHPQGRLNAALAALRAGELRWLHIPARRTDGVPDALAVERPVLAVDAPMLAAPLFDALRVAARVARLRRLWLLIRASARTWPAVCRWTRDAPGPFIVESPPGCQPAPAPDLRAVAVETLDADARHAVWRAEVEPEVARHLAAHHALGRAGILAVVDAVRLRGEATDVAAIEAELARRAARQDR